MIKVYEINMSMSYGDEKDLETEINKFIKENDIEENEIVSFSWKNPRSINLFVKNEE